MAKTPEKWLEETAPAKKAGVFKWFLGYAPGVGKTYNMLSENAPAVDVHIVTQARY